jgi:hypothetical protein
VLGRFNALVPRGERSQVIERLMTQTIAEREACLAAVAHEFETHPDFAEARAVAEAFEATASNGIEG